MSQIDIFTSAGQTEWSRPQDLRAVSVSAVSGGGGGGSGARRASGGVRTGGAGGGGGGFTKISLPAFNLADAVSVSVGTGGVGAAAITVDDTNGIAGRAGTRSTFGMVCTAWGATAGGNLIGLGTPATDGGLITGGTGGIYIPGQVS